MKVWLTYKVCIFWDGFFFFLSTWLINIKSIQLQYAYNLSVPIFPYCKLHAGIIGNTLHTRLRTNNKKLNLNNSGLRVFYKMILLQNIYLQTLGHVVPCFMFHVIELVCRQRIILLSKFCCSVLHLWLPRFLSVTAGRSNPLSIVWLHRLHWQLIGHSSVRFPCVPCLISVVNFYGFMLVPAIWVSGSHEDSV